jgi:hypothetical protein
MDQMHVKCPHCSEYFELGEAFQQDMEKELRAKLKVQQQQMEQVWQKKFTAREEVRNQETAQLKAKIEAEAQKKAQDVFTVEMSEIKEQLAVREKQVAESRKMEADLRRQKREVEDKGKELELELLRRLEEETVQARAKLAREMDDKYRLRVADKDRELGTLKAQVDELNRKIELGSQQSQGEVLEQDLEARLRADFPMDTFTSVGQGVRGADIIQTVIMPDGRMAGKILWETKRTKAWTDTWIHKVKEDLQACKADIPVIVSLTVPKDHHQFSVYEGVWVSDISSGISLGRVLRDTLIKVMRERGFQARREDQKELIYDYLTGQEFRNRVESVLRAFMAMRHSITQQRRAMEKQWAAQEKCVEAVLRNLSGMSGEIEVLAGKEFPVLNLLGGASDDNTEMLDDGV